MKKHTGKIATVLIAAAMGLALSSTSGFAAHHKVVHHKAAVQPAPKPLFDFVPPVNPACEVWQTYPENAGGPGYPNFGHYNPGCQ